MKINSSTPPPVKQPSVHPQAATNSPATAPKTSDASTTTHLQKTAELDATTPPFDSQRVAEIRQAIAEGRFQIDSDKIASSLIDSVRDLLASDRPSV